MWKSVVVSEDAPGLPKVSVRRGNILCLTLDYDIDHREQGRKNSVRLSGRSTSGKIWGPIARMWVTYEASKDSKLRHKWYKLKQEADRHTTMQKQFRRRRTLRRRPRMKSKVGRQVFKAHLEEPEWKWCGKSEKCYVLGNAEGMDSWVEEFQMIRNLTLISILMRCETRNLKQVKLGEEMVRLPIRRQGTQFWQLEIR